MLIRFHVENFLSFREEQEFSLSPGRVVQHPSHVIKDDDESGISILRTAAIFGKNASGKSNFINAIIFARDLIVSKYSPSVTIPVRAFRLDRSYLNQPSKFRFEVKLADKAYDYGFAVNRREVVEESLYEIKKTSEKMLFNRSGSEISFGKIDFSLGIQESEKVTTLKQAEQRLTFVGADTRPNQLFLSATVERNQPYFKDLYEWFDKCLHIVKFDSLSFAEFMIDENPDFIKNYAKILTQLDTGIEGIELQNVDVEREFIKAYPYLESLRLVIDELEPGNKAIFPMPDKRRFLIKRTKEGILEGCKMMTKHKLIGEDEFDFFEINWESEGTQRLMDLIPKLFLLKKTSCTIFIDELARSLHPDLTYKLIKLFLEKDDMFKSQLIFTSHEDFLLDFDLLRRDEIWFIEKKTNESKMYSLEEFKPRYDKDIRKGYFHGRFGGTPIINMDEVGQTLEKI